MKKNYFKSILAAGLLISTLSSCLKDDRLELDPEKGVNVIEFANPSQINKIGSIVPLYVLSYPIVTNATVVPISVAYAGPEDVTSEDITVNIALDPTIITPYNDEQHTTYEIMPTSMYSISTTSVVIPKGSKTASFNVSINTSQFDLAKSYVLPLKIASVSSGTISGNFGKVLLNFGAKNPYDGLFNYKTSAITSLAPNQNKNNVPLITTGPNTVRVSPGLLTVYSNEVTYTVDPATNKVTVACPSLGVQTPQDTRSNWNPATKTLTVFWKQGNGGRTFEEVYTYQGVRP